MEHKTIIYFLFSWIISFIIFETLFNTFAWHSTNVQFPTFKSLKIYYHEVPTPIVVFGDLSYSTMIFINTIFIYNLLFKSTLFSDSQSNLTFLTLMISIQILYDLIYYCLVTYTPLHKTNDYFDFFKKYAKEFSYRAIIADSIYLALWFLIYLLILTKCPVLLQYYIMALGLFLTVIFSYEDV